MFIPVDTLYKMFTSTVKFTHVKQHFLVHSCKRILEVSIVYWSGYFQMMFLANSFVPKECD
jgi:hypothetical protein